MRNATRELFNAYMERIGELNHVDDTTKLFTVDPSVQQTLRTRLTETSAFMGLINVMLVDEIKGEVLGLGDTGLIASRTDTTGAGRRVTRDPTDMDKDVYECAQTNYDTRLNYAKLDAWAKFPNFQELIRNVILRAQALDRMRVGFNGTSVAQNTNRNTNPMGQDVNKGWLQKMRDARPEAVLDSGSETTRVTYGTGATADFENLDAMIYSAAQELLEPWHRNATDLVVICGSELLNDKYFPIINTTLDPTEQIARDVIMSTKRLGNMPAYQVPFFPADACLITSFDNLSIYEQEGKRRRFMKESPEVNAVENFESSNDAFAIEDLGKAVLVEKIALENA
jgi:P2 family phage major capsid protein